jgi:hypothetical protein
MSKEKKKLILPIIPLMFALVYVWAAWYYGDVFRMARERSFWVASSQQMEFLLSQEYGTLWYIGRMMMMLFRHPWLGALPFAAMITWSTWCLGYGMRLNAQWRWLQYIPAGAFLTWLSYEGVNLYFENEAGIIMGIPFCTTIILSIWAGMIASFSRKKSPAIIVMPKDETQLQNLLQVITLTIALTVPTIITEIWRPYTRVVAQMNVEVINKDWKKVAEIARDNAELSYRPIAAHYAIALVNMGQICDRLYDIRLDYDSVYIQSKGGKANNNALPLYQEDCDYYAGLVQTCIHHAMERVTMIGPNIHSLQLLTKCALLKGELQVAKKYLRILKDVPFEKEFVEKYSAYVENPQLIESDAEMAFVRKFEPMRDVFENVFQQPVFLGYNAGLMEGRSMDALKNSLAVCMYSKSMPNFMMRTQPLAGTMPPENVADALCLMISKDKTIEQRFPHIRIRLGKLSSTLNEMKPYMKDRPKYAKELFPRYKGYYPYYYFFGNLKATKKTPKNEGSSTAGVN